jgi:hypothetical protein
MEGGGVVGRLFSDVVPSDSISEKHEYFTEGGVIITDFRSEAEGSGVNGPLKGDCISSRSSMMRLQIGEGPT